MKLFHASKLLLLSLFVLGGIWMLSSSVVGYQSKAKADPCSIYGKIKFVDEGEDYKVKLVSSGAQLKIRFIQTSEEKPGLWTRVSYGQKFKLKWVDSGEDFRVMEVKSGEGCVSGR